MRIGGAVMFGILDKIGTTAAAIAGVVSGAAISLLLAWIYVGLIHDPSVIKEARRGYVTQATMTALQAQVTEMQRQFKVAEMAAAGDRVRAEAAARSADDAWKKYEAAVAADTGDDGCRVGADDLEWVRKSR